MSEPATRAELALAMDIGQHTALIGWFSDGLAEAAGLDDDLLAAIKGLPLSLRTPTIIRLQEAVDILRDVVATLAFALIDLGLQPA